jgi:outer membrane lipoprotein SlyB
LIVVTALAGCAPPRPPVTQASPAETAAGLQGPAYATVASVRPIGGFGTTADTNPDAAILPAMGVAASAMPSGSASSEIVVRTDGGETLSVVQPDAAGLSPGERVMVLPGGLPRLTPVSPAS